MGGRASRCVDAGGIREPPDAAGPRAGYGRLDEGRETAGGRRQRRLQSRAGQRRQRARGAGRSAGRFLHHVSQAVSAKRVPEGRRVEMSYSRRDFLKAAGSGVVLTAVAGETLIAGPTPPSAAMPFASEKASFIVNGK